MWGRCVISSRALISLLIHDALPHHALAEVGTRVDCRACGRGHSRRIPPFAARRFIDIADVRQLEPSAPSTRRKQWMMARQSQPLPPLYVHELLAGAAPILPERAAKPPPHPSLAPRLEALRAAQEDREYAKLIGRSLGRDDTSVGRDEAEMATYRSQLGVGVNLIVSMATMFIVGAYAGGVEGEPFLVCVRPSQGSLMLLTMAVEMSLFLIGRSVSISRSTTGSCAPRRVCATARSSRSTRRTLPAAATMQCSMRKSLER